MDSCIKSALKRLKTRLSEHFGPNIEVILFGSAARGDNREWSDVDVLVLLPAEINISLEEEIFDIAFEVGLEYDLVFGVITYSKTFWNTHQARMTPLYENIQNEGIAV
jgi:predicted nucleotidyltransferase